MTQTDNSYLHLTGTAVTLAGGHRSVDERAAIATEAAAEIIRRIELQASLTMERLRLYLVVRDAEARETKIRIPPELAAEYLSLLKQAETAGS